MISIKQILLNEEKTPFYITEGGALFREDTKNWYKPYENCGYLSYMLKWNGKTYPRRVHRLVAEAYIPNPENKPIVHHKDHNPFNNNVENLEWRTIGENNQDKHKPIAQAPIVNSKMVEKDEQWKQYMNSDFWVSNMGRVKNKRTGNVLKGNVNTNGYLRVGLRIGKKINSFNVHSLVWLVWRGKSKNVIDHINGDKLDNRLENLQDIPQSENIIKNPPKTSKLTASLDENKNILKVFSSQRQAEKYYNMAGGSITRAIVSGKKSYGMYWKTLTEEDYV
jgi:hypothetical protein